MSLNVLIAHPYIDLHQVWNLVEQTQKDSLAKTHYVISLDHKSPLNFFSKIFHALRTPNQHGDFFVFPTLDESIGYEANCKKCLDILQHELENSNYIFRLEKIITSFLKECLETAPAFWKEKVHDQVNPVYAEELLTQYYKNYDLTPLVTYLLDLPVSARVYIYFAERDVV